MEGQVFSLEHILAQLGAEYLKRLDLEEQIEALQARWEKLSAKDNSPNGVMGESGRTVPTPSGVEPTSAE